MSELTLEKIQELKNLLDENAVPGPVRLDMNRRVAKYLFENGYIHQDNKGLFIQLRTGEKIRVEIYKTEDQS